MTVPKFSGLDPKRSRLRATVVKIQESISNLPLDGQGDQRIGRSELVASWADLVAQLALGPEPEVRECPECHHFCMRDATRCGHCFSALTPPPDGPSSDATA